MADESSKETGQDQLESLIDDLIRENAELIETAGALPRAGSRTSMLERLLLSEAVASALADALAPALAEALAPKVMERLEQSKGGESAGKGPTPAAGSSGAGQKRQRSSGEG